MKVAIDTGGTFVDVLAVDDAGRVKSAKLRSDPTNLSSCVRAAVKAVLLQPGEQPDELLYGTTHALNALLTHRVPPIGLVVNRGFRDLLETARLPDSLREADATRPAPERLVPLERVSEVDARMDATGQIERPVDPAQVKALASAYRDQGVAAIAVSLLHSYANPTQEREVSEILRRALPEIDVVLSSEVLPELREYERTLATCLNACLRSVTERHFEEIAAQAKAPLWLMQSSGGLSPARQAAERPLSTALSGPAAAVVGMTELARRAGHSNVITVDIGGTSTDVALIRDGVFDITTRGEVAGFPWKAPMIDVHSMGAGGGSLASEGPDGRWRVGPESAGAVPGPVCYGEGGASPTLTDAHLVLGRLPPALLGGELSLDEPAARKALGEFGAERGFDAERTAKGLLDIATHDMCGAIRRVSVLRGHDPKAFTLLGIGGAGPLHAAELAALLGIGSVLIPTHPGLAAAVGLLSADIREDFVRALGQREDAIDVARMHAIVRDLESEARAFLVEGGERASSSAILCSLDVRYEGMLHDITVPLPGTSVNREAVGEAITTFHEKFEAMAGHSHRDTESAEVLNVRVTAIGRRPKPLKWEPLPEMDCAPKPRAFRSVGYVHHRNLVESAIYDRDSLGAGSPVAGPAVIEQAESTIIVPPEFEATIDVMGNAILQRKDRDG